MNKWGQILIILLCAICLNNSQIFAQRASAEFISSIAPPSLVSGEPVKDGVQELIYHNGTLYVISVWAGIQVVDVSDIYNPKEIGRYQNEHRARNLYIQGTYGFLADEIEGVHILDMSDPRSIVPLGKIETVGDAWWVVANYPYVYVAEEKNGVQVYDVSDASLPKPLGKYDTPGWAWGLAIVDQMLYVADKTGGLQIVDFTDKNNPKLVGQFLEPKQAKSIHIEDNYLYLTDGPNGLFILDISNPQFPALVSKINSDGFIFDVYKGGKYLYMANESRSKLEIINLTDITAPQQEATYQADDKIFGVWKEDVYVFVAANNNTLILRHNSPPVLAAIDSQTVDEVSTLIITPEGYDPDGDQVYYEVSNLPEGAEFDSLSGVIRWTPTYEQSGTYNNITVRVIERTASKLYTDRSFSITVNHVNRAPSLPEVEDQNIDENALLSFSIEPGADPDVEDKGRLSYRVENLPQGAQFDSLSLTFTWTPGFEQSGTYVLDFLVVDPEGAVDRDASTITVNHVDRKPELNPIAGQQTDENKVLEFTISGTDPDQEDQNKITFQAKNLPQGASFDVNTQTFSWTPGYDQSGEYPGIQFIMTAGSLSDTISTSITVAHVSRPPVLAEIGSKSVDEAKTLSFTISGSDTDAEDQEKLQFKAENLPEGATFNPDSLIFKWTPNYEQSGNYQNITFIVTDVSGLTASRSIDIVVNHVNRPPVIDEVQPVTSEENIPVTINVSGSDPDVENKDNLQYSVDPLPEGAVFENNMVTWTPNFTQSGQYELNFTVSDGKLSDTKSTTITITHVNRAPQIEDIEPRTVDENTALEIKIAASDPDSEDLNKWTLSASQLPEGAVFNAETATISWTPTYEQAGSYTVKITNSDPAGLSAAKDIQITVNHVNRTPVLEPVAAQTTQENEPLTITLPAAQDPDAEDAQKLIYEIQNLPEGAMFDNTTRTLTWTPTFEQSGEYDLVFTCSDGEFTVTQPVKISVNHVNRSPVLTAVTDQTVDENQPLTVTVDYSDPDTEDSGKLQIAMTNIPQGAQFDNQSGTLTWTPTFEQAAVYPDIKVTVTDPSGASVEEAFSITVNNVNREPTLSDIAPISGSENASVSFQVSAQDPDPEDNDKLQISSGNLPAGASLDPATGSFSWTPNYTQAGTYSINIKVQDPGGLTTEKTAEVSIANVNRAPQIQSVTNQTVNENDAITIPVTATDEDTDDELKFSAPNLPDGASLDGSSGTITWTPNFDQAGNYNITVTVADNEVEASTSFNIEVVNVNRAPSIDGGGSVSVQPGETATLSFSANDPDDDQIRYESNDLPGGASLNPSTGEFSWTPGDSDVGTYTFTVTASDGTDSDQTSATVNVTEPPQPEASPESTPETPN